ncbi:MAG TPA: hypothetical protein VLS25_11305 [Dehalococcoidia bacterium]|nr:hypothetical protein [Dehalococcoidia bacterium]
MASRLVVLTAALVGLLLVSGGPTASRAAGFQVPISTGTITGQQGKMLLFFATPAGGGETSVACASIDADVYDTPDLVLKEMPQSGNPCEGGTPDAFILPGTTTVTAGVYVGGSQTPEKQVSTTVDVQFDFPLILDGTVLSADTVGDADCSRKANSVDALQMLRHLASLGDTACLQAANVKCDDGMTAVDALLILRHVAGLSLNLPQGCPSPFAAPVLVSPEDGAILEENGNWHADLDWDPVEGASQYGVQVDCDGCCVGGYSFCSDVGQTYTRVPVITETARTVQLVGANVERWRVWAVNEDGTPGDFSEWRTFDIEVPPSAR